MTNDTNKSFPRLTQEQAKKLNSEGSSLLCLDVPPKTLFGIDYMTFEVGTKFKGVKMIPPGIHYIHTALNKDDGRMGFFICIKSKQVLVYKWHEVQKFLIPYPDNEQMKRFQLGMFIFLTY